MEAIIYGCLKLIFSSVLHSRQLGQPKQHSTVAVFVRLHENVTPLKAFDRSECANLGLKRFAQGKG